MLQKTLTENTVVNTISISLRPVLFVLREREQEVSVLYSLVHDESTNKTTSPLDGVPLCAALNRPVW